MSKDSFILYNDMYELIKYLDDETAGKLIKAIFEYTTNKVIPEDKNIRAVFMFIKNQIDKNDEKWEEERKKRSEAGKKHKGNQYTKQNGTNGTSVPRMEQNGTNGTDNVNVNVNVINNKSKDVIINKINNIVDFLNEQAGTKYKSTAKETQDFLKKLLLEYTEDEIKQVTSKMVDKWKNTKMEDYLRPSTLYRKSNFDEYYGLKEGRFKTQQEKNKEFFEKMKDEV